ncbi:unnamed protein product [Caenorhabditis brenneri]
MSDISLDYEGSSDSSRSSSRENSDRRKRSRSRSNDKPMWKKKDSQSSSSSQSSRSSSRSRSSSPPIKSPSPKRKREPIRAPSLSPRRKTNGSTNRRSRSPPPRRNRRSQSPRRRGNTSRSRSPARRRVLRSRSPQRMRRHTSKSRSPPPRRSQRSRTPPPRKNDWSRSPPPARRRYGSGSRSPSARSPPRRNYRRQRSNSRSPAENRRNAEERRREEMWISRRNERINIQSQGLDKIWGHSPSQEEIQETYKLRVAAEEIQAENAKKGEQLKEDRRKAKKREMRAVRNVSEDDSSTSSESEESEKEEERKKKKVKKSKKSKKDKKKEKKKSKKAKKEKEERRARRELRKKERAELKRKINNRSDTEEEWEEKKPEHFSGVIRSWKEGSLSPTPILPEHIKQRDQGGAFEVEKPGNYGKDLLKGEGAGMAAYAARGERIPRRGEIGLSSGEIAEYEKVGYVMSGSRHKAMEATRLRKENQILTAEEKRLLSGVSMEAKKKKEEAVLEQFRSLIRNKNMRN